MNTSSDNIKKVRLKAGLTQTQSAALLSVCLRSWQNWEAGERKMPDMAMELYLIKTGQVKVTSLS